MTSRLFILAGLFLSQVAFAAASTETPKTLDCVVEAGYQGQVLADASLEGSMELKDDGKEIQMILFGDDRQFEVLVQYYRSDMEDDGTPHERIEVAINDLKNSVQEDYISSKVKSLLYVTSLSGTYLNKDGKTQPFDSIVVECHPSK